MSLALLTVEEALRGLLETDPKPVQAGLNQSAGETHMAGTMIQAIRWPKHLGRM